jgi:hypothetical protein
MTHIKFHVTALRQNPNPPAQNGIADPLHYQSGGRQLPARMVGYIFLELLKVSMTFTTE